MLLRLLFNWICSSCFQSQILYEVSKIICPYIGRGKGAKKRRREERTKGKWERRKKETRNHTVCWCGDGHFFFFFFSSKEESKVTTLEKAPVAIIFWLQVVFFLFFFYLLFECVRNLRKSRHSFHHPFVASYTTVPKKVEAAHFSVKMLCIFFQLIWNKVKHVGNFQEIKSISQASVCNDLWPCTYKETIVVR